MSAIESQQSDKVVWSRIARTFHWVLAVCIFANFLNDGEGWKTLHRVVGYIAFATMILRVGYGTFAKSDSSFHSKFKNWRLSPLKIIEFLKSEIKQKPVEYEGHNPAACYVYISIWIVVAALGISGFMMGLDAYWGEEWLEELHGLISNILIGLLVLHFGGIAKDAFTFKRKTWMRMINGRSLTK